MTIGLPLALVLYVKEKISTFNRLFTSEDYLSYGVLSAYAG